MKKIKMILLGSLVLFTVSCNNTKTENKDTTEDTKTKMTDSSSMQIPPTKPFEGIIFASKRDTICGMPLSAGVADTMHVNGKIYGFCATECKEEFAKQLAVKK